MLSEAIPGPVKEVSIFVMLSKLVHSQTIFVLKRSLFLCILSASLDLETFPHKSQGWETPVIWLTSIWPGMFLDGACFPQMLQVATYPLPSADLTSVVVIIVLICSSRSCKSVLIWLFVTATVVLLWGWECHRLINSFLHKIQFLAVLRQLYR